MQNIKTNKGYTGQLINQTIDGKISRVVLNGCTYSDEHWYDEVPTYDIKILPDDEPKKIQVWLGNENTVPMKLGVYEDITELTIPINNFGKDMEITFEEYIDNE